MAKDIYTECIMPSLTAIGSTPGNRQASHSNRILPKGIEA